MAFAAEDYIVFVDESGNDDLQVIAGLFVPVRWVRSSYAYLDDFRASEGIRVPDELKAAELATGRGLVARRLAKATPIPPGVGMRTHAGRIGQSLYERALTLAGSMNGLRVVAIGLRTRFPVEAYRLWFWSVCAGITAFPSSDRPRVSLMVIDGQDQGLLRTQRGVTRDFYYTCRQRQTYIGPGSLWFMGGAVLHESHSLPFIQTADLVAHAAFQAILGNPDRAFMHTWYRQKLCDIAHQQRGRIVDASTFCLHELVGLHPPAPIAANARAGLFVP
jgi:hypothetical protein